MMAEAEAMNGIFAPDDITEAWYRAKGMTELPYPRIAPGPEATWEIDETLVLADVRRVEVEPLAGGTVVRVETPEGARVVAHARDAAHARFIADEIDVAYRAHLRRG